MSGHMGAISGIAFTAGDERVVTCSYDKTIHIWNTTTGEEESSLTSPSYHGRFNCIAVMKDRKRVVSCDDDWKVEVWDLENLTLVEELNGHRGKVYSVVVSPDEELVASGGESRSIMLTKRFKNGQKGKQQWIETGFHTWSLCFSPDGKELASGLSDNSIRIFQVGTRHTLVDPMRDHEGRVTSVLWSLDGRHLFSGSFDKTIRKWDRRTGRAVGDPWRGHDGRIHSLALSPDGTLIASASSDNTIRFWDTNHGQPVGEPLKHRDSVLAVAFSPTGKFIASGDQSGKLFIWRPQPPKHWQPESASGHSQLHSTLSPGPPGAESNSITVDQSLQDGRSSAGIDQGTAPSSEKSTVTSLACTSNSDTNVFSADRSLDAITCSQSTQSPIKPRSVIRAAKAPFTTRKPLGWWIQTPRKTSILRL
ncbi:hypothetical protein HYDPIDRAFT_92297 [Hydnomerulius pinastri MD-312]|uniref:WD40 repeat-like protein n=1 Tax=Hydnomerulius pinastri MD-312 TaxID=994086 RepID=A0A0C9WEM0_9AGAM|nr:hypothetical protein HYDPIDRAFT_92297 [Hydnomerulius pinastri MD-312]